MDAFIHGCGDLLAAEEDDPKREHQPNPRQGSDAEGPAWGRGSNGGREGEREGIHVREAVGWVFLQRAQAGGGEPWRQASAQRGG